MDPVLADAGIDSPDLDAVPVVNEYAALSLLHVDPYRTGVRGGFIYVSGADHGVAAAQLDEFTAPEVLPLFDEQRLWSRAASRVAGGLWMTPFG